MHEGQAGGMQGHAEDPAFVDNRRFTKRSAVLDVAANRMSKLRQMDSNLIGSSSLKAAFEFAENLFVF